MSVSPDDREQGVVLFGGWVPRQVGVLVGAARTRVAADTADAAQTASLHQTGLVEVWGGCRGVGYRMGGTVHSSR